MVVVVVVVVVVVRPIVVVFVGGGGLCPNANPMPWGWIHILEVTYGNV